MGKKILYGGLLGGGLGLFCLFLIVRSEEIILPLCLCGALLAVGLATMKFFFENRSHQEKKGPAAGAVAETVDAVPQLDPQLQARAENSMAHITALLSSLKNAAVRKEAQDCARLCGELLAAAEERPEAPKRLDNFYNHYLPMFEKMLENYAQCETADVLPEGMESPLAEFLDVMESALKKLKENVYTGNVARLAVDMDVLETLYRSDGLLDDGLFGQRGGGAS